MDIRVLPYPIGFLDPQCKYNNPLTGQPYTPEFRNMKKFWTTLNTYTHRNDFFELMIKKQVVIAIAATGSGKNAVIPQLALHYLGYNNFSVFVAVPNTKPAIEGSKTAALELNVELGKQVGHIYDINLVNEIDKLNERELDVLDDIDDIVSNKKTKGWDSKHNTTKIVYGTDTWLQSYLNGNPLLDNFGCVFIDEVHKRTVNQDLVLSKLCDIALQRPEFRIVIMSATLDPIPFEKYFNKLGIKHGIWNVVGDTLFPIEKQYSSIRTNPIDAAGTLLEKKIDEVLKNSNEGNIIVFVSTNNQAKTLAKKITSNEQKYNPIPRCFIYTRETADETGDYIVAKAIKDFRDKSPKDGGVYGRMIIFATNLGEASITYKNMAIVIDSGLENKVYYNPDTNAIVSGNEFIARSNIGQRCGRTGRDREGKCVMMYSENQYNSFKAEQDPEITITEMTNTYLNIITDPIYGSFEKAQLFFNRMVSPPPIMSQYRAMKNLLDNELVYLSGYNTMLGHIVKSSRIYGYKAYKMIIAGWYFNCMDEMIHLVAIMHILDKDGIDGFFDINKKEKDKQTPQELEKTLLIESMKEHYKISYSDHLTAYRIYNESRHPAIFEIDYNGNNFKNRERRIWLNERGMRPNIFTSIDSEIKIITKRVNTQLYEIVGLELFNVVNNERQRWKLQDLKGVQRGGNDIKHSKQSKPLLRFLNSFEKTKQTKQTKTNTNTRLSGGATYSMKNKPDTKILLLDKLLNNIIIHSAKVPPFKTFDTTVDNILACIFFGNISDLAIIIDLIDNKKTQKYLVKNSSLSYGTIHKNSMLSSLTDKELKSNPIIAYNKFEIRNFNLKQRLGEINFCSIIFPHIMERFGISIPNIIKKL